MIKSGIEEQRRGPGSSTTFFPCSASTTSAWSKSPARVRPRSTASPYFRTPGNRTGCTSTACTSFPTRTVSPAPCRSSAESGSAANRRRVHRRMRGGPTSSATGPTSTRSGSTSTSRNARRATRHTTPHCPLASTRCGPGSGTGPGCDGTRFAVDRPPLIGSAPHLLGTRAAWRRRPGTVPRHARLTYLCASSAPSWLRRLLRAPDSIALTGIVSSCGPTVCEVCANHCRPGSLSCSAPRMCAAW